VAEVDKGQIQQVFSNLTINADQAMANGGHLFVTMENVTVGEGEIAELAAGKYVKVTVRDEGEGIEKHNIGQIFDPYFSTKRLGSGLGLATSYSIMKKHGGRITVESTPAVGTTFTLYLPVAKDDLMPVMAAGAAKEVDGGGKIRVLVVDDEEMICKVTGRFLERAGFVVELVQDGRDAIASYKQAMDEGRPFGVVIMDLTIPGGMGGREAVKKILEIDGCARVIVSSGYADDPVMANYATYGFCGVAAKPYSRDKLLAVVRQALAERYAAPPQ
jgi:CheY-like chemotaxis protein